MSEEQFETELQYEPVKQYTNKEYMYVNSAGVFSGPNDFIIEVETLIPEGLGRDMSLLMTPKMAKKLNIMLTDAVNAYENYVGEILVDNITAEEYKERVENPNDQN